MPEGAHVRAMWISEDGNRDTRVQASVTPNMLGIC